LGFVGVNFVLYAIKLFRDFYLNSIEMPSLYQYPFGVYAAEQPLWMNFHAANYSLKNFERTRPGVINRAFAHIKLPMPKEPGYQASHQYGESNANPVGPLISRAGLANSGGFNIGGAINMISRVLQPSLFYHERLFATSTYRRFSNIAEMTMVSEARKQYFFQYILVPKTNEESIGIENIVGTFRKASYPTLASNLPERTYPQNLWSITVTRGNGVSLGGDANLTANWLGEPLVCVLNTVIVKKNDDADSVIRYLPNGGSSLTLLGLVFTEFETGTYVPQANATWSKSEVSDAFFGYNG